MVGCRIIKFEINVRIKHWSCCGINKANLARRFTKLAIKLAGKCLKKKKFYFDF